jgi:hypothetical protein
MLGSGQRMLECDITFDQEFGLKCGDKMVVPKHENGYIHFFQVSNGDITYDFFKKHELNRLIYSYTKGVKYLGFLELKNGT